MISPDYHTGLLGGVTLTYPSMITSSPFLPPCLTRLADLGSLGESGDAARLDAVGGGDADMVREEHA